MAALKVLGYHAITAATAASAAISFASLHQVDLYAFFDQLNQTIANITKLAAMGSSLVALGLAAYRTWGTKTVPAGALVVDVGAPSKAEIDAAHPPGNSATVETINGTAVGKVVGALLLGLIVFVPHDAGAQQRGASPFVPSIEQFGLDKLAQSPLVKALGAWGSDDVNGAVELSTAIPDLQDTVGQACWKTFAAMGAVVQKHPLPATFKLATDIEAGRLFLMAVKNVCKKPECSQVFTELTNQIGAFTPLPPAISLTSICAKIP